MHSLHYEFMASLCHVMFIWFERRDVAISAFDISRVLDKL